MRSLPRRRQCADIGGSLFRLIGQKSLAPARMARPPSSLCIDEPIALSNINLCDWDGYDHVAERRSRSGTFATHE